MWNELKRYRQLPRSRRLLLWEALFALALARLVLIVLPFRKIAFWLGTPATENPLKATAKQLEVATHIGWAVDCLARRAPWDSRCLAQALAATWMLRRRGLASTVSFGAALGKSGEFVAHAWSRFGSYVVTGRAGRERFKPFTSLARKRS